MAVFKQFTIVLVLAAATGVLTQTRDPCVNFLCQNGGSCTAPADAPYCICPAGFFGTHCEYNRNPCYNFSCQNGGYCTAPADAPYCVCPRGYFGDKCQSTQNKLCQVLDPNSFGVCGGKFCSSDSDCSGQICCASACGGQMCTTAEPDDGGDICPGGCAPGQICKETGIVCVTTPCPTHQCVAADPCGGCPAGEVCKATDIVCKKAPCPTHQCVATDACGGCPKGQKCETLFPPCARPICEEDSLVPCVNPACAPINTCVPDTTADPCNGCPEGQICKETGIVCITTPCPTHRCVAADPCGGCPAGQVCKATGIVCIRAPCPSHECVATDACGGCPKGQKCHTRFPSCPPPPPCDADSLKPCIQRPFCVPISVCEPDTQFDECARCTAGQVCQATGTVCIRAPCPQSVKCVPAGPRVCNLACRIGYVCQLKAPKCPISSKIPCSTQPVPTCVPQPKQLASCPKPAIIKNSAMCVLQNRRHRCDTDNDCDNSLNERCCPNQCNIRQCTVVPSLQIAP